MINEMTKDELKKELKEYQAWSYDNYGIEIPDRLIDEYINYEARTELKNNGDLGDVRDWVSPSEKLPDQHQKIQVIGEGSYYSENDKVVMNTGGWYVDIEDFKAWRPCR